jgi:hypothetical protein
MTISDDGRQRALTPKQMRFTQEFVIDLNATQAAIRAGYSAKTANEQGARLLANASIAAAIATAQGARAERLQIDADKVLADLERRGQMAERAGQFAAAIRAAELQGKHLGMFIDRRELVTPNADDETLEAVRARRRALEARLAEFLGDPSVPTPIDRAVGDDAGRLH